MNERYITVIRHGESSTLAIVIDTAQPETEQPCIVKSWNTKTEPYAVYLANDFCVRHNAKENK